MKITLDKDNHKTDSFGRPIPKGFDLKSVEYLVPKELNTVPVPNKIIPDTSLNFFEKIKAKFFINKFEGEIKMWNTLKNFLIQKILQWLLKIAGGFFLAVGISQNSIEEIISAIVSILIGIIYSLITHKKIALTDPKDFLEFK